MKLINLLTQSLKYKKSIVITFVAIALISAIVQFGVPVNYSMTDFLPKDSPSTKAIDVMDREFTEKIANARVMIENIDIQEAIAMKQKMEAIDGISDVMWLDDVIDIRTPIEVADSAMVETYYKDNYALFTLHIEDGQEVAATDALYELIGEENALSGDALDTAISQKATGKETLNAALILIPIIIFILLISTRSWMEPVLFLTAIGISVVINLGTNIFIGEISFISQAVAPILQLAVSLDYAIFLLHSFDDYRKEISDPKEAMALAMKRSFPAIAASASTTFFGFLALTFMNFELGADLGLNLVKGILLSFLSVVIFLPALTLMLYKYIDKTHHKQWFPNKYRFGKHLVKLRFPIMFIVALVIVPAFLAQNNTGFLYGMGEIPEETRAGIDVVQIEEAFGKYTPMVLLVEKGDLPREVELISHLESLQYVKSVASYTNVIGATIPPGFLDEEITENFFSNNYSRIIIHTTTDEEGEIAFRFVEEVREMVGSYYEEYYMTGEAVTLYDMKQIVEKDNRLVNILTVVAIALVLLVTFRSLTFPIILLLTIQTSVWINLSIPYFSGDSLVYIGYLIISIVQLAATVDYAILFSEDYTNNRKELPAIAAIVKTINEKTFSIGVSASILSSVGFILWATSSDPIISAIGLLLGRGTLLAFLLVVLLLPALLIVFDRFIEKTTWKANFYKGE